MRVPRFTPWPVLAVLAALVVAAGAGCSSDSSMEPAALVAPSGSLGLSGGPAGDVTTAAPSPFSSHGLVDLSLDRLTVVEGTFRGRTILTGQEPGPWVEGAFAIERRVVGLSTPAFGGPTYVRESVRHVETTGPSLREDRWRQDHSGLYLYQAPEEAGATVSLRRLADRAVTQGASSLKEVAAFARAVETVNAKRAALLAGPPGGALSSEITFLRYPLHKGASWEGRPGFNVWTVEGFDRLEFADGSRMRVARLRIELPGIFGPDDSALTWWDEPGEVKREFHLFGDAVDEGGNVIGRFETYESFALVEYVPAGARL